MSKFYITTPIYYVNGLPYIGAAYTSIAADVLARYHRALGDEVRFLMGTDENAQKNVEAALRNEHEIGVASESSRRRSPVVERSFTTGRSLSAATPRDSSTRQIVQKYVDEMAAKWQETWDELGLTHDDFIRTTEPRHVKYVEKFWGMVKKGDIYKGTYEGLYCTGCEAFKTETELVGGLCPDHQRAPEKLREENYFFRLSNYRDALLAHIEAHPEFIQPEARRNEVVSYIKDHAKDFSISRENLEWGIPVPEDPSQTIYVWFDALLNYMSAVAQDSGVASESSRRRLHFSAGGGSASGMTAATPKNGWWPADLHLVGKDIIKFHCAYFPAMLMSAGMPLPKTVFAHGFFTIDGQKMSKTLGNVVDPVQIARKYGNDVLRYYLLREIPFGGDGDFSEIRLRERYNGELANGIGNLVARVLSMVERYSESVIHNPPQPSLNLREGDRSIHPLRLRGGQGELWQQYETHMAHYELDRALDTVWSLIGEIDTLIDREQPWALAKKGLSAGRQDDNDRLNAVLYVLAESLRHIAWMLLPFMPDTAQKIFAQLGIPDEMSKRTVEKAKQWGGLAEGVKIARGESLFPRLT